MKAVMGDCHHSLGNGGKDADAHPFSRVRHHVYASAPVSCSANFLHDGRSCVFDSCPDGTFEDKEEEICWRQVVSETTLAVNFTKQPLIEGYTYQVGADPTSKLTQQNHYSFLFITLSPSRFGCVLPIILVRNVRTGLDPSAKNW